MEVTMKKFDRAKFSAVCSTIAIIIAIIAMIVLIFLAIAMNSRSYEPVEEQNTADLARKKCAELKSFSAISRENKELFTTDEYYEISSDGVSIIYHLKIALELDSSDKTGIEKNINQAQSYLDKIEKTLKAKNLL